MAVIKPFKGLRFNEEIVGNICEVVCPPYDIIPKTKREELVAKNKFNMVNLELPKGENLYKNAAKILKKWQDGKVLLQDKQDAIYIYEEEFLVKGITKKIKGVICLVKIEEFSKNIVLPHEETLSKAKTDRFNLISETYCNFSQIYSLYMDENRTTKNKIDSLSQNKADIEITTYDNIVHRMWFVNDEKEIEKLANDFENRQLFIADGHHRYETALNFKKKLIEDGIIKDENHLGNFVMMMLVDMENEGLVVFPTYRLIKDLLNFNIKKILQGLDDKEKSEGTYGHFSIEKKKGSKNIEEILEQNSDKKVFAFYVGNDEYYLLTLTDENAMTQAMPEKCNAYRDLDVAVLHTLILEVLGIDKENMANEINLSYTRDLSETIEGVDSGKYQCSFILNATKVSQIKDVALAGEKMPQKSTYFYPKIITGLVINKIMDIPN